MRYTTYDTDYPTFEECVAGELSSVDMDARYDEWLDEAYSHYLADTPFANMSPATMLEECDPVAYRCGKNDFLDGESRDGDLTEIDEAFYNTREVEDLREQYDDAHATTDDDTDDDDAPEVS